MNRDNIWVDETAVITQEQVDKLLKYIRRSRNGNLESSRLEKDEIYKKFFTKKGKFK